MSDLKDNLILFRRDLHRIPELDSDLPKTTAYIKSYLTKLPCEIIDAGPTGFCALFKASGSSSPDSDIGTIAFRSDMDALPIEEENDTEYRSEHSGIMHACGHDGHMSILLGFASEIAENLDGLKKNVLLIFQAAEETTGGANLIVKTGVFKDYGVERIYGLHLWPGYPKDTIICRKNEFMASTLVFEIEVKGRSSHVATYRQGIDALEIGSKFVNRVYKMEKEDVADGIFRLLRFGIFESGTASNVVPDRAFLSGTLRTYDEDIRNFMWDRMKDIADDLAAVTGCKFKFSRSDGYPAVINPPALYDEVKTVLTKAGFDFFELNEPLLSSEDFACYQQEVPGLFLHLGTGMDLALHKGDYEIDEDVLPTGVAIFKTLLGI